MAFREVVMWEILNVLRRLHRGEALAVAMGQRAQPAATRGAGDVAVALAPHAAQIRAWFEPPPPARRGLRLTKVHQLLGRLGVHVPYSSLYRFAKTHCGFGARQRVTVRMADVPPGEVAEIDFGRLGRVRDPETGKARLAWALVVVLACSRHQYVHVTYSQRVADVIGGLEDAWVFFGGVGQRLVVDNFPAAITKADRYDPIFQRTFEEYAQYRGFVIDAAPVRQPTGKPHVERGVPYVRENFFRGETWRDLPHVHAAAIRWCREVAGVRVHGTTQQRPLAVFENVERATLRPIETARFDPPQWALCTVHPDHHLMSVGKAFYSLPTRYIGERVWVRRDTHLVRIFLDGTLIKTHPLQAPGGKATDHTDYPAVLTPRTRSAIRRGSVRPKGTGSPSGSLRRRSSRAPSRGPSSAKRRPCCGSARNTAGRALMRRVSARWPLISSMSGDSNTCCARTWRPCPRQLELQPRHPRARIRAGGPPAARPGDPHAHPPPRGLMMLDVKPSLKIVLTRLKLSGLVPTLSDRAAYAQKTSLTPLDFLELALQDEIERRDHVSVATRLARAGFTEPHTFEVCHRDIRRGAGSSSRLLFRYSA